MADQAPATRRHPKIDGLLQNNSYIILVLVLTIFSLAIMVVQMLLRPDSPTYNLVNAYNNLACIFFLFDFAMHMIAEPRKRDYFIGQRGYFDLLGSIPSFGFSQYTAILRIFRLSRLFRMRRLMNPENRKLLRDEILDNRGRYALLLTAIMIGLVLSTASILVLFFESKNPDANITTGGDALWWATVTITTVGYGDKYPITTGGRFTAVLVMFTGVGVIGALASILASILIPPAKPAEKPVEPQPVENPTAVSSPAIEQELAAVKTELAALRQLLEKREGS